jgi:RimJ/RimL family protein N-acetyltransferase
LRALRAADAADFRRLEVDPRVVRFVGDGQPLPGARIDTILTRAVGYPANFPGLGCWYARRRDTGDFVGWFVLKYCGRSCDIEVGYRLLPEAWGQGFATEGASAVVRHAFDRLELDRLIGVTHPDNVASQRVLMKAGLADAGWGRYYGRRLRLFAARRFDFGGGRVRAARPPR